MIRTFTHPNGQTQRLAVGDLLGDGLSVFAMLVAAAGAVPIVYSDPPWNPGNEKWWRRHAGASEPRSYDDFLDAWCAAVAGCGAAHVFTEQSVNTKHHGMLLAAVERCAAWRLPLLEEWTVYYGTPGSRGCMRPNTLLHFGEQPLLTDPSGLRGVEMTRVVFAGLDLPPGTTVADPCMGKGMTSRLAHERGWHCIGTELNHRRLDFTIRWLQRQGYEEVLG